MTPTLVGSSVGDVRRGPGECRTPFSVARVLELLLLRFPAVLELSESFDQLLRLFDGAGLADELALRSVDFHLDFVERQHDRSPGWVEWEGCPLPVCIISVLVFLSSGSF